MDWSKIIMIRGDIMKKMKLVGFWGGILTILIMMGQIVAAADEYPQKAVTIICPYSPGGGSDVMVRVIAHIIEKKKLVPVPVVVVNKTGGGGLIGKNFVYTKPADGYYMTLADLGNIIYPIVNPSTKWKTSDWVYLANLVYDHNLLCVKSQAYKDLASLMKAAKASEKPFTAGGTGTAGGPDSMCTLKLNEAAGTKISYVPLRGGGEVVTSLLGGHINMGWFNPSEILSQIEAGKAVALAVTSEKRLKVLPKVPTFRELGYDVTYVQQRGLCMKKGTPPEVKKYWIDVLSKVIKTSEWEEGYLKKNSLEDGWLPGVEFDKWVEKEVQDFKKSLDKLKKMGG
jgi:putative tricarboxylic transport membrane protein